MLLNKPVGYVSGQAEDGYGEPALVLVKAATQWREDASGLRLQREHLRHLVPAGRLDIDSTSLLVLTHGRDRMHNQLIGRDEARSRRVSGARAVDQRRAPVGQGLRLLNHDLELDGEALQPARASSGSTDDQLRFVLVEGAKAPDRRHVRGGGPGDGPASASHRPRDAGRPAGRPVALSLGADRILAVRASRRTRTAWPARSAQRSHRFISPYRAARLRLAAASRWPRLGSACAGEGSSRPTRCRVALRRLLGRRERGSLILCHPLRVTAIVMAHAQAGASRKALQRAAVSRRKVA